MLSYPAIHTCYPTQQYICKLSYPQYIRAILPSNTHVLSTQQYTRAILPSNTHIQSSYPAIHTCYPTQQYTRAILPSNTHVLSYPAIHIYNPPPAIHKYNLILSSNSIRKLFLARLLYLTQQLKLILSCLPTIPLYVNLPSNYSVSYPPSPCTWTLYRLCGSVYAD